ncbi:MAG: alginate export family protein [Planctomycetales bacterium]|nr:alginate export family protein [Planctomycetales bacterium]
MLVKQRLLLTCTSTLGILFPLTTSATAVENAPVPYVAANFAFEDSIVIEEEDATVASDAAAADAASPAESADEQNAQSAVTGNACSVCAPCAVTCSCSCCTAKKKAAANAKAAGSHKGVFYANDFSYLKDPCYSGALLGDGLKNIALAPNLTVDFGGEYRARMHSEHNHRGLGLTGNSDDFLLHRTRMYLNAKAGENIRFFGEVLDANSNYEADNPRPIEENRWDAQNLFIDATLWSEGATKLVARGGRQEILLGDQRYVSPLDWANTRRTFDGGRVMYSGAEWNVDGFWLAPLVRDTHNFDRANENQAFYGVYTSYKGVADAALDFYWIAFDNDAAGFQYDSIGSRYKGKVNSMLVDLEGAYQLGDNVDGSSHDAGFFTIGLGKKIANSDFDPTTWLYFDWASGDDTQASGNGHHHFQPLAHKYNGFMDLFGRRNLMDLNWLTTMQLTEKVKLLSWYHSFWLEDINDTPYTVVMTPFAPGVAPGASHLGQELDLVLSVGLSPRSNVLFGYSYFWAGNYFDTPGLPTNDDANFFYTQFTTNF